MKKVTIFTPYHVYTAKLTVTDCERFRVQFGWCRANAVGFSFQSETFMIDIPKPLFDQTAITIEDDL